MAARKILLLNGPNLDMLGTREPEVYGQETLATLEQTVRMHAEQRGAALSCYQSNSEGKLIGKVHGAMGKFDGIVYNPGAHTHYSYALRDAVAAIDIPVVEVHLSDIDDREPFRRLSVIAPACVAQVKGLGVSGYCRAVDILVDMLEDGGLHRLGEGYEARFAPNANVRIAGQEMRSENAPSCHPEPKAKDLREALNLEDRFAEILRFAQDDRLECFFGQPQETEGAPSTDVPLANGLPADSLIDAVEPTEPPQDYTAPFAAELAGVDGAELCAGRLAAVRSACERLDVAGLLVRDTSNIHWVTGFDGVFDEERAHALLVTPDRAVLHTDSRYSNALRTAAANMGGAIAVDDGRTTHFQFAHRELAAGAQAGEAADTGAKAQAGEAADAEGEALERAAFEGRLGIEDTITYAEYAKAVDVFAAAELVPTSDVVLSLRAVKSPAEIVRLRAAQAITDAAFTHIIGFMRLGMTERDVQRELEDFMLRHGADGLAFGSIVACGENGADPHAIPGDKKLEAGQCVVMDFGARAFGYCSDMTRMVFLGAPQGEMARAWDVLRQANETVEAMLRPGVTGREAHETAERVLAEGGFAGKMGHGLGHGVGLECHELPVLNTRNGEPLAAGNVVTVEPGIYLPGKFGMRLEDCGVITATGYDVFSRLGHGTVVI